jgi:hypothetical protein
MVFAAAFPAVYRFVCWLPRYRSEGIVKDHHKIFCAERLAAVMTHCDGLRAVIIALGTFPAHYRVIPSH